MAFIYGWELTLVITAAAPLIVLSGAIVSQVCNRSSYSSSRKSASSTVTKKTSKIFHSHTSLLQLGVALTRKELNAYAKAGSIAEEVLGSIRTVVAFGGEKKECERSVNMDYKK